MPSLPSPKLPKDFKLPLPSSALSVKQCPPQYIGALCDFCAQQESDRILRFKKGDHGVLLKRGTEAWWGVKIGKKKGWVPAAYWHMLQVDLYLKCICFEIFKLRFVKFILSKLELNNIVAVSSSFTTIFLQGTSSRTKKEVIGWE